MKPFSLKRAMDGHEIICLDGRPAKFISFDPHRDPRSQVHAKIDGELHTYRKDGRYHPTFGEYPCDLFMKRSLIGEIIYRIFR